MFEDLLALCLEEAANLLDARELLEEVSVLELGPVLRVVPHQVLGQEDARVEPLANTYVNFLCSEDNKLLASVKVALTSLVFVNKAVDFSGK